MQHVGSLKGHLPSCDELHFFRRSSGLSVVCGGTYLQPALAILEPNLTQGILHCFACLSNLLDVSHWKLIHYSADTWLGRGGKGWMWREGERKKRLVLQLWNSGIDHSMTIHQLLDAGGGFFSPLRGGGGVQ